MYPLILKYILQDLIATHPSINGAEIVSREGISLVSYLPDHVETDWIAAIGNHVLTLALYITQPALEQPCKLLAIDYQRNRLVIAPCRTEAVIMVWLKSANDLADVQPGLERAVQQMLMII